jgi:hypothetical protein
MFAYSKKYFDSAVKTSISLFSTVAKYTVKNINQINKANPSDVGKFITKVIVTPAKDAQKMIIEKAFGEVYLNQLGSLHRNFWNELIKIQKSFPESHVRGYVEDSISIISYEIVEIIGNNIIENS